MIYPNIAEYEPGDSILARQTILDLHKEIERLIKGCIALEEEIDDLRKLEITITRENERLNNIINELEKMLEQTIENSAVQPHIEMAEYTLKELKELKGSDKE